VKKSRVAEKSVSLNQEAVGGKEKWAGERGEGEANIRNLKKGKSCENTGRGKGEGGRYPKRTGQIRDKKKKVLPQKKKEKTMGKNGQKRAFVPFSTRGKKERKKRS